MMIDTLDINSSEVYVSVVTDSAKKVASTGDLISIKATTSSTYTLSTSSSTISASSVNLKSERLRFFNQTEGEVKIEKGENTTVDFCLPHSVGGTNELDYTFAQNEDDEDKVSYTMSFDQPTGKLRVASDEYSLLDTKATFKITATSKTGETYISEITIEEEVKTDDKVTIEQTTDGLIAVGAIVSIFGGIIGGSLIQALWMVFNQQKLLMFFILINTYMDVYVRVAITKQDIGLFELDFLGDITPKFINSPKFTDKMNVDQKTGVLKEIGFEYESSFRTYWMPFITLVFCVCVHIFGRILFKLCPKLNKFKATEKDKQQEEDSEGNKAAAISLDSVSLSSESSSSSSESAIQERVGEEDSDEEKVQNEGGENLNKDRKKKPDKPSKVTSHDTNMSTTNTQMPLEESKSQNFAKTQTDLESKANKEDVDPDPDPSPEVRKEEKKVKEQKEGTSSKFRICKILLKRTVKGIIPWFLAKLDSQIYWNIYFRFLIETFMGALIMTVNEIKTNQAKDSWQRFSLYLAYIILIVFLCFYGFVCFISVVEFKRRKGYELVPQSDDPDNKPRDVEKEIYGEIFASIDKSSYAAFHQPLVMGRIMIVVFIILVINVYDESTIWMVFCIILILQIGYIYQAIKIPKFEWWPLKVIYLINEIFLLAFICVFGILRTRYDWRNSA